MRNRVSDLNLASLPPSEIEVGVGIQHRRNSCFNITYLPINVLLLFFFLSCSVGGDILKRQTGSTTRNQVRIGAQILLERYIDSLRGKRIGVICNQTSILPDGVHLVDTLLHLDLKITALFGPEHGIRGISAAGKEVRNNNDGKTNIPVYSLYGKIQKPAPEMLNDVDLLIFDIQDVGARFYTYISTMAYCMEAAAENHKKIFILDRPNPIDGDDVEGPLLDTTYRSFIGMFPISIRHGMTIGELALMIVGEKWIKGGRGVDLQVVPIENWKRSEWYDETSLPWILPSPNMRTLASATVYPGTCLFEATNVCEGRGTDKPFEYIGAPWIEKDVLAGEMNRGNLDGVKFESVEFTPKADSISSPSPKFNKEKCGGVFVRVTDRGKFKPFISALKLLGMIQSLYPENFKIKKDNFNRLVGINLLDDKGKIQTDIDFASIEKGVLLFRKLRSKYLLY